MHLAIGAEAIRGQPTSPTEMSDPSTVKPEDTDNEHSLRRLSTSHRDEAEPTSPSSTTTAKLSPKVAESLKQGISHLTEMAPCHHFAHQALNILQFLAKKWNIEVDIPPDSGVSKEIDNSVRPNTSSLNFFAPNVNEDDFLCAWGIRDIGGPGGAFGKPISPSQTHFDHAEKMQGIVAEGQATNREEQYPLPIVDSGRVRGPIAHTAKSLENPLFWPFPMQGRPMLPEGTELEKAGFRPL